MEAGLLFESRVANEAFCAVTTAIARQVSELQGLCLLGGSDAGSRARLADVGNRVADCAVRLEELEASVDEELKLAEEAASAAAALVVLQRASRELAAKQDRSQNVSEIVAPHLPAPKQAHLEENKPDDTAEGLRSAPEQQRETKLGGTSSIQPPTAEQLLQVPQYMRGRLTIDKLETACWYVNRALERKYAALATPRAKQGTQLREMVLTWLDQECEETQGLVYFVTIDDIILHGKPEEQRGTCIDVSSLKSALQVLRFLGVLKLLGPRYCTCPTNPDKSS